MGNKNNCEYCHEPNAIIDMHNNQRIWVVGNRLYVKEVVTSSINPFAVETSFKITHCPECGRLLDGSED